MAFGVPQPWQQAAWWERRSYRTKASKALLRITPALLSHMNSVCPCFVASLHCLQFCSLTLSKWGQKSGFLPLAIVLVLRDAAAPHHDCVPSSFLLFLISCVLSPVPPLSYLVMPVSISLLACSDSHVSAFAYFSLSFPHHFLPDKKNVCPFTCLP